MCHQSKGLAQRSLIHELNVMRGKELQRYNRPHSETFTCEVCSYVRIQWVCFWRSDSEIIIPCARGVCDFKPHVTVCKFNKLILEDQHAHTSSSSSLVLNISTNTVARDSQKLTDSGATDAGPGIPVPLLGKNCNWGAQRATECQIAVFCDWPVIQVAAGLYIGWPVILRYCPIWSGRPRVSAFQR